MLEQSPSFSRARTLLPGAPLSGSASSSGAGEAFFSPETPLGRALDLIAADPELEVVERRLWSPDDSARNGSFGSWPEGLDPRLVAALSSQGCARPYSHQAQGIDHLARGRDVVVATPTASGKSLVYRVPIVDAVCADRSRRALLMFPTKALARDQVHALRELAAAVEPGLLGVGLYDGDTPPDARRAARRRAHVVATNPDMLHRGLLPNHESWARFLAALEFIVLDEVHVYRGVFGGHVGLVLRRLLRLCAHYGARPRIVACSATIANPGELVGALTGREVAVVDEDGSPAGPRAFWVVNPRVVDPHTGVRRNHMEVTRRVATALRAEGVPTLAFCRTRKSVELLTRYLREDEAAEHAGTSRPDPAARARADDRVRGYRGGYLPERRREVERAMRSGEARLVAATSALELGMDIGGLDAVVLSGYPGSVAATLQRAGRAGRRGAPSATILVLSSRPQDQFLAASPEHLFARAPEHARVDLANPELLVPHLRCAAFELPLTPAQAPRFDLSARELAPVLDHLAEEGAFLRDDPEGSDDPQPRYLVLGPAFPADDVDLRGPIEEDFAVLDAGSRAQAEGDVLARVDFEDAPLYLHPGAIYPLEGRTYQVDRLDWDGRKAYVQEVDAAYYTEAVTRLRVRVVEPIDRREAGGAAAGLGYAHLVRCVPGFKKIRFRTHENIGYGPVELPDLELHTLAAYFCVPDAVWDGLAPERRAGAMLAAAHALRHAAASCLMCEAADLGHAVTLDPLQTGGGYGPALSGTGGAPGEESRLIASGPACLLLYDRQAGGAGLSRAAFELAGEVCGRAAAAVAGCRCARGCPTCLGRIPEAEDGPTPAKDAWRVLVALAERLA